jgi:hypothetical protein
MFTIADITPTKFFLSRNKDLQRCLCDTVRLRQHLAYTRKIEAAKNSSLPAPKLFASFGRSKSICVPFDN